MAMSNCDPSEMRLKRVQQPELPTEAKAGRLSTLLAAWWGPSAHHHLNHIDCLLVSMAVAELKTYQMQLR